MDFAWSSVISVTTLSHGTQAISLGTPPRYSWETRSDAYRRLQWSTSRPAIVTGLRGCKSV